MPNSVIALAVGWAISAVLALAFAVFYRHRMRQKSAEALRQQSEKFQREFAERREIERELAHMASFSEMAPNPIIETDTQQQIHYINPAAQTTFPDLEKLKWMHPVFEELKTELEQMQAEKIPFRVRPMKLGDRIYDQQISLLDGGPRVRLYFSDITELKRLDQLKTDFVNLVSHELRSPLTTITASMKLVTGQVLGPVNSDQERTLKLALLNIDRLARLINELLDVSKIEAGKLELAREKVNLATLAEEISRQFQPLARERGLELAAHVPQVPTEAFVDRDKIIQVLTNLTQNALKFTEKGYIAISVFSRPDGILCEVADSGPGISAENLPKVFAKFQQFGAVPRGREKGTGLGLSLCKGIVDLHGGRIWVESEPGQGSRFIFLLPREQPASTEN